MITIIILGIDPGTTHANPVGWGMLKDDLQVLDYGVIELDRNADFNTRMWVISKELNKIFKKYSSEIDYIVFEEPFGPNKSTMKKLGQVIGVVRSVAQMNDIPVYDGYTPSHVKKIGTGNGNAPKDLVNEHMSKKLKGAGHLWKDEADALCIAYTGLHHYEENIDESVSK